MRTLGIASVSVAALVALAFSDAKPAEARHGGMSFSAPRASVSTRSFSNSGNKSFTRSIKTSKPNIALRRAVVHHKPPKIAKIESRVLKKGSTSAFVQNGSLRSGKLNLGKLPIQKVAAGNMHLVSRLSVPKNFKPKLTVIHAPGKDLKLRLSPFVQRSWKKAFFWVAIAGVGYVTVPELYYDRFYRCASVDDPDYDECVSILSYAAVEEEDTAVGRVRAPMPRTASYRYTATVAPTHEAQQSCSFEPFVDRQWNRSFVWVQIPQTGNVTVPEDFYDRFYGKVGGEPPNYTAACKVLVEAAAADTVATTSPDLERPL